MAPTSTEPTQPAQEPVNAGATPGADPVLAATSDVHTDASASAEPVPATTAAPATEVTAEVVEAAGGPARQAPGMTQTEAAAALKARFPALLAGAPKPLKLRIQVDIQAQAPGVFSKQVLSAFFRRYTGSHGYLLAITRAPHRFDLAGQPAGEITEEHKRAAIDELSRRRTLQETRRAEEDAQRLQRANFLHDFERTTLSPANFCSLKGVAPEALDELLAQARREAQEMAQRPPVAGLRDRSPGPGGRGNADRRPGAPREQGRPAGGRRPVDAGAPGGPSRNNRGRPPR